MLCVYPPPPDPLTCGGRGQSAKAFLLNVGAHFAMTKPISQAGIARALGVSAPMITKYKAKGMPVNSLASAYNWLAINHPDRAVEIRQNQDAVHAVVGKLDAPPAMPGEQELTERGPAAVVARLVQSENVAWEQLSIAMAGKNMTNIILLTKYYRECAKARLDAENQLVEYQVKTGELIPVAESVELVGKVLGVIKTQLSALPYSACSRANPTDPALAREAIDIGTEKMKAQIMTALKELVE